MKFWNLLAARWRPVALLLGLAALALPCAAQELQFPIYEFEVRGNSLLGTDAIEASVMPHMGEAQTLKNVEAARAALAQAYQDAGYLTVVVAIPEQNVDSGVLQLQVTEAPVERLRVTGAQYTLPSALAQRLDQAAEGRVPNFTVLQQQLESVNRSPDIKVSPVLKAGKTPGMVDVQLEVEDQLPLHGSVELANRQSPNTTPTRLSAALRYDNLWQAGHSLGMTMQTSPEKPSETGVITANYMVPLGSGSDALTTYLVSSRSQFASLPGGGSLGASDTLGAKYAQQFGAQDGFIQTLSWGADYKHILQSDVGGLRENTLRYLPLSLSYRGIWLGQPQPTVVDANLVLGARGLLGNSDRQFDAKRAQALSSFAAARAGWQGYADLPGYANWTMGAKVEGQLASGVLLPSEQFVGGGADSVRGYLEGERSGDQALRASFEISSPNTKLGDLLGWRIRGLAFIEGAVLQNLDTAAEVTRLFGLGVGARVSGPRGLSVMLDAAQALTDGDVRGGGTSAGTWRANGRVSMEF
jgi:hemolysin activation/secretion protein